MQTKIWLLLNEQSVQGLHWLPFHYVFSIQLQLKLNLGQKGM